MFLSVDSSGDSHGQKYAFDIEFFAEVVKSESAWNTKGRHIVVSIAKKDKTTEYWPRLLKQAGKNQRITVDWSKWIDEDDLDENDQGEDDSDMRGFGGMPGMGGMGGMGGMMGGMGGMGGMDLSQMMAGMGGMGGMPGMGGMGGMGDLPDSDDEEEEAEHEGAPTKPGDDGLGDLDGEAEK